MITTTEEAETYRIIRLLSLDETERRFYNHLIIDLQDYPSGIVFQDQLEEGLEHGQRTIYIYANQAIRTIVYNQFTARSPDNSSFALRYYERTVISFNGWKDFMNAGNRVFANKEDAVRYYKIEKEFEDAFR